jgi:hypothetical protein
MRNRGLNQQQRRPHVDGHDLVEQRHVGIREIAPLDAGGVVHQRIQLAEGVKRGGDDPRRSRGVGDVVDAERGLPAEFFHERLAAGFVAAVNEHLRAFGHGPARDRFADAGRAAGDENGFAFEAHGGRAVSAPAVTV